MLGRTWITFLVLFLFQILKRAIRERRSLFSIIRVYTVFDFVVLMVDLLAASIFGLFAQSLAGPGLKQFEYFPVWSGVFLVVFAELTTDWLVKRYPKRVAHIKEARLRSMDRMMVFAGVVCAYTFLFFLLYFIFIWLVYASV